MYSYRGLELLGCVKQLKKVLILLALAVAILSNPQIPYADTHADSV